MEIIIREMKDGEENLVRKIGRPSFGLLEQIMFAKPKAALVAMQGDEIVGATSYRIFEGKNNQKIGYVEVAYIRKGYQGQGIGNKIYTEVTKFLKAQGCDTVTAIVRDDNVASWRLFEKNGYHIMSFTQMIKYYGLLGALGLWINSLLALATGHHMWGTVPKEETSVMSQLSLYLLLNIFVLLPAFFFHSETVRSFTIQVFAMLCLLIIPLLGEKLVTRLSKDRWTFRVARGGILVSMIISALGGTFPIIGRFYPDEYKTSKVFKKEMGLNALAGWVLVLVLIGLGIVFKGENLFWKAIVSFGTSLLFYRAIPLYPFECLGGKRIWEYSKLLGVVALIISIGLLIIL